MAQYVVCSKHIVPAKVRGELPDVITQYVSTDSHMHWHYQITRDKSKAYIFENKKEAKETAHLLSMRVEKC